MDKSDMLSKLGEWGVVQEFADSDALLGATAAAAALGDSLAKLAEGELITPDYRRRARELDAAARDVRTHAKIDTLSELLGAIDDRIIVFSEHLPTLRLIAERVREAGRRPVV